MRGDGAPRRTSHQYITPEGVTKFCSLALANSWIVLAFAPKLGDLGYLEL